MKMSLEGRSELQLWTGCVCFCMTPVEPRSGWCVIRKGTTTVSCYCIKLIIQVEILELKGRRSELQINIWNLGSRDGNESQGVCELIWEKGEELEEAQGWTWCWLCLLLDLFCTETHLTLDSCIKGGLPVLPTTLLTLEYL